METLESKENMELQLMGYVEVNGIDTSDVMNNWALKIEDIDFNDLEKYKAVHFAKTHRNATETRYEKELRMKGNILCLNDLGHNLNPQKAEEYQRYADTDKICNPQMIVKFCNMVYPMCNVLVTLAILIGNQYKSIKNMYLNIKSGRKMFFENFRMPIKCIDFTLTKSILVKIENVIDNNCNNIM